MGLSPPLTSFTARSPRAIDGAHAAVPSTGSPTAFRPEAAPGLLQIAPITDTTVTIIGAVVIVILIGLSAFFSSSEIAMFSLAQHRVDSMLEDGIPGAKTVNHLKENPHRLLITILVGNNIVNIAMSSIATAIVAIYFDPGTAVLVSTFGITTLVLLFGESAPKSYAVENTESWGGPIAPPPKK
jgi:putative hemolysin